MALVMWCVYFMLSVGFCCVVVRNPKLFWPLLILSSVGAADLMIGRFTIVDELLIGFLTFGGLLAIGLGRVKIPKSDVVDPWGKAHRILFIVFSVYMIFQGIRGMLILGGPEKLRWVVYYALLGSLALLLSFRVFEFPEREKAARTICVGSIIYLVIYTSMVIVTEMFIGVPRWIAQTQGWQGGAFSLFSLAVGLPAVFILYNSASFRDQILSLLAMGLSLNGILLANSRISLISFFLFFILTIFLNKTKKNFAVILVVLLTMVSNFVFTQRVALDLVETPPVAVPTPSAIVSSVKAPAVVAPPVAEPVRPLIIPSATPFPVITPPAAVDAPPPPPPQVISVFIRKTQRAISVRIKNSFQSWGSRILKGFNNNFEELTNTLPRFSGKGGQIDFHDQDRIIHIKAGVLALTTTKTLLFGYGYRVGGFVIGPYIFNEFNKLPGKDPNKLMNQDNSVSTEGFTNILVDTGWIGLLLFLSNYFFVGRKIFLQRKNKHRWMIFLSLLLVGAWLPLNNLFDLVLYFLLIMPGGLLVRWAEIVPPSRSVITHPGERISVSGKVK